MSLVNYINTKMNYLNLRTTHVGGGIEYEAKFLEIDVKNVKSKLKEIGAKRVHKRFKMVRSAYDLCGDKKGFARVRSEYKKTTMTVKTYDSDKYANEHEITIFDDFKTGENFLIQLGLRKKAYQESYREKYIIPNRKTIHEIVFDDMPGLPTYMEIDCVDEDSLNEMIDILGLDKTKMRYGSFGLTYQEYYGIEQNVINNTPMLTFGNIENELLPEKNKELLKRIAKRQKKW